jgi:glycosyltransferase involved in cell wall biosynthesis
MVIDDKEVYRTYKHPYKSVLFVLSNSVSDFRMLLAAKWMSRWGYNVNISDNLPEWLGIHYDVIVCPRPNADISKMLVNYLSNGIKVIIDMDDDFYSIPKENPAYNMLGEGAKGYHKELRKVIEKATAFVTTTKELAIRYGRESVVINNYYDEENPLWKIPAPKHMFSIGWIGTDTHRQDFNLAFEAISRILSEREDVRVVIGNDPGIYNKFEAVPERQKLFFLGLAYPIYPVFYKFCDVVVSPLEDNYFNRAKSDIKLLEANASGVPWVASPLPMYFDYRYGGMFAKTPEDWYSCLTEFMTNSEILKADTNIGSGNADGRTSRIMAKKWEKLISSL